MAPVSSKEFLDIQATIECRFTLKRVREMIRTYYPMHRTDKYSQHSSIIWPVSLNGRVPLRILSQFLYELRGCHFEYCRSHLNFRYGTCFEKGCTVQISTHNRAQSFGQFGLMDEWSFTNYVVLSSNPVALT